MWSLVFQSVRVRAGYFPFTYASLLAQTVENLPAMWEIWV